jgi:hypothetical protein
VLKKTRCDRTQHLPPTLSIAPQHVDTHARNTPRRPGRAVATDPAGRRHAAPARRAQPRGAGPEREQQRHGHVRREHADPFSRRAGVLRAQQVKSGLAQMLKVRARGGSREKG